MELYGVSSGYEQGNSYQKRIAGRRAQRSANAVGLGDAIEKTRLDEKQTETGLDTEEKIQEGINTFEGSRSVVAAKGSYAELKENLSKQPDTTLNTADSPEGDLANVDEHSTAPQVNQEAQVGADSQPEAPVADETTPSSTATQTSAAADGTESSAGTVATEGVEDGIEASAEDTLEGGTKSLLKSGAKAGAKFLGAAAGGIGGGLTAGMGIAADLHGGFSKMNTAQKIGNVSSIAGGSLEMIGAGAMMVNPILGGALELGGELLSLFGSGTTAGGDAEKKDSQQEQIEAQAKKTEQSEAAQQAQLTAAKGAAATGAQTGTAFGGQQQASAQIVGTGSF